MKPTLVPGLKAELRHVVQPDELLSAVYPGGPPVFATPFVLGLMEHASARAIQPHLDAGEASVGYGFEFQNLRPVTPSLMDRPIGLQGASDIMPAATKHMAQIPESKSVADVEGPWSDPPDGFTSSLIERCKRYWNTPISQLPDFVVATYLNQKFAAELMIAEASRRIAGGTLDGTELYDGHLEDALRRADRRN